MRVVLDTCAIIDSDLKLRSADFIAISDAMQRIGIEILIPDVVMDELVNHTVERVRQREERLEKDLDDFNRLADMSITFSRRPDASFRMLVNYKYELERQMRRMNWDVLLYPSTPHWEVVEKAIQRTKPFRDNGAGYRDYLIWATILEDIDKNPKQTDWCFISSNIKDFFEKGPDNRFSLHQDLQWDLQFNDRKRVNLTVFESVNKFRKDVVNPRLVSVSGLDSEVMSEQFLFQPFKDGSSAAIARWFDKNISDLPVTSLGLGPTTKIVEITRVDDEWKKLSATVRERPGGGYTIDLVIEIVIELKVETPSFDLSIPPSRTIVSTSQQFIISAIFDAPPDYKVLAMDAILLSKGLDPSYLATRNA